MQQQHRREARPPQRGVARGEPEQDDSKVDTRITVLPPLARARVLERAAIIHEACHVSWEEADRRAFELERTQ